MLFLIELEIRSYEMNAQCLLDIQAITVQFSLRSKTVELSLIGHLAYRDIRRKYSDIK